jgi:hypothetical protein
MSGLNVGLLPSAISKLKDAYIPMINCKVSGTSVPDSSYLTYQFTNTVVQSVYLNPELTKATLDDGFIAVTSSQGNMLVTTDYTQSAGEESTPSTSITMKATDVDVTFSMVITAIDGRPRFDIQNTTFSAANLDVSNAQGYLARAASNYNNNFEFKNNANIKFAAMLESALEDFLNNNAQNYQLQAPLGQIDDRIMVDNSLVRDPLITKDFVAVSLNETFFVNGGGECPAYNGQAQKMIPNVDTTHATQEFQLYLSDYSINTLLYSFWCTKLMHITLPEQIQNLGLPFVPNTRNWFTDDLAVVFPQVIPAYGSGNPITLTCANSGMDQPDVTSSFVDITGYLMGICKVQTLVNNQLVTMLDFTAKVSLTGNLLPQPQNQMVLNASDVQLDDFAVNNNNVPALDNDAVKGFLTGLIADHVPYSQVVTMPIGDYVSLNDPAIVYMPGYVEILSSADFVRQSC